MAQTAYLSVKGAKQGQIKGGVILKGKEGMIAVYAFTDGVISPRDPASGLPTGRRMHKPLVITKEIDKSTPLLFRALVSNEVLTEVVLHCYDTDVAGKLKEVYSIKLTNASISSMTQEMLLNKTEPGLHLPVMDEVSFTYQKIEWTWVDGGVTASDDWESPIV